jgi:hypothetical protein
MSTSRSCPGAAGSCAQPTSEIPASRSIMSRGGGAGGEPGGKSAVGLVEVGSADMKRTVGNLSGKNPNT